MKFTPTDNQIAIFNFIENEKENGIINAVAGSGKTTTIIESFNKIPTNKKIIYLVFNKRNQVEAEKKIPSHVVAKTFHSLGYAAWARHMDGKIKVSQYKCNDIIRHTFSYEDNQTYRYFVLKLVSLAKGNGMGFLINDEEEVWQILIDHFDLDLDTKEGTIERGIEIAREVLNVSNNRLFEIDFDDMLYLPVLHQIEFKKYDFIFVDEAQDTNGVQREILKELFFAKSRFIAVGDPYQAIYGFRGASSDAMSLIKSDFSCKELPLTVSFRCAIDIVREAKEFCPNIEAREKAEKGTIRSEEIGENFPSSVNKDDLIICRNTAPLIDVAYTLINNGVGCDVLGRDIGKGLISLIKKLHGRDIPNFMHNLENYERREVSSFIEKGKENRAFALQDKCECINIMIQNLPGDMYTIDGLIRNIEKMFKEQKGNLITLCTIHKAKGLEAPRVFILDRFKLMPSRWAKLDWQVEQENNLIYVAITRAKSELVYLNRKGKNE